MLGGELIGSEWSTAGRTTTSMLHNYFTDCSFIGASALDLSKLLTDYSREIAELRSQILIQARVSVLLADSIKFTKRAPVWVNHLDKLSLVICDEKPNVELVESIKILKLNLLLLSLYFNN